MSEKSNCDLCELCGRREALPLERCPESREDCPLLEPKDAGDHPTVVAGERNAEEKPAAFVSSQSHASLWSGGAGDLVVGQVLGGRFLILGRLGGGGMGEVFEAHDQELGLTVALKFLKSDAPVDSALAQRFRGEVRLARSISHPNVCRTFDIGEIDSRRYISLEYVAGADLGTVLRWTGGLRKQGLVRIAKEICCGLSAVHDAGIVHGDLKPANVLLDRAGRVKLTDFGLARVAAGPVGQLGGTPAYMAPELFDRETEPDARSDIYALGVMLYELAAGRLPLIGKSFDEFARLHREQAPVPPGRYVARMDSGLQEVILRCLAKDPKDRFQDVAALQLALSAVEQGMPLAALLPERNWVNTEPRAKTLRALIASCIAVLVATILLAGSSPARSIWSRLPMEISREAAEERGRRLLADLKYKGPAETEWLRLKTAGKDLRRGFAALGNDALAVFQGDAAIAISYQLKMGLEDTSGADHDEDDGTHASSDWPFASTPAKHSSLSAPGDALMRFDGHGRLISFHGWPAGNQAPVDVLEHLAAIADLKWDDYVATDVDEESEIQFESGSVERLAFVARDDSLGLEERIEVDYFRSNVNESAEGGALLRFERSFSFGEEELPAGLETTLFESILIALGAAYTLVLAIAFIVLAVRRAVDWGASLIFGMVISLLMVLAGTVTSIIIDSPHLGIALLNVFGEVLFSVLFLGFFFFGIFAATESALSSWWPQALEGWNRLRSHGMRDVQVEAEFVLGMGFSAASIACVALWGAVRDWIGWFPVITVGGHLSEASVASAIPARMLVLLCVAVLVAFVMAGGAAVFRRLLRRPWIGAVLTWCLLTIASGVLSSTWIDLIEHGIGAAFLVLALYRLGLVGLISALFFYVLVRAVPLGFDEVAPFPASSALALAIVWLLFLLPAVRVLAVVARRRMPD